MSCDPKIELIEGDLTGKIINAFYQVYDGLGYGFLESVYRSALALELASQGLVSVREAVADVFYKGTKVGHFKADLIVEQRVVVEVKASKTIGEEDEKQVRNYLRATNLEVALLLHFGPKANFRRSVFENGRKITLVQRP